MSYAQESDAHKAQVRRLRDLLVAADINAILDQVHAEQVHHDVDWPQWCLTQIEQADFVLVVVSAAYKRRADSPGQLPEDEGRGVHWEARRLRDILYNDREKASKVLPVLLPGQVPLYLPELFNRPPDSLISVTELTNEGVRELVQILRGERPLPSALGGAARAGWVYGSNNAHLGRRESVEPPGDWGV